MSMNTVVAKPAVIPATCDHWAKVTEVTQPPIPPHKVLSAKISMSIPIGIPQ